MVFRFQRKRKEKARKEEEEEMILVFKPLNPKRTRYWQAQH